MQKKIIFLGHSLNIQRHFEIAHCMGLEPVGFVDKHYFGNTSTLNNLPVIGTEDDMESIIYRYPDCFYFVGISFGISNNDMQSLANQRRCKMIDLIRDHNLPSINLIHPSAVTGRDLSLGQGIFIDALSRIQNGSDLADFCFIKEQCCVTHHAKIGFNTTVCQQTYVGAAVEIGSHCYIGIKNALIAPDAPDGKVVIGDHCITHPGVVIMRSLPAHSKAKIASSQGTGVHPVTIYQ